MAAHYADEHLDSMMRNITDDDFNENTALSVLNREDGEWYKGRLEHFKIYIYPNYENNGTVLKTMQFIGVKVPDAQFGVKMLLPSEKETEQYVRGNFGYEHDSDMRERAFSLNL